MMKNLTINQVKICHITTIYDTINSFLLGLLRELNNTGYQTYAISSPCQNIDSIKEAGTQFYAVPMSRKVSPCRDLYSLVKLYTYFRKNKIHILQTHTPKAILLGQIAARLARVPIIITTLHGTHIRENTSTLSRLIWILFYKFVQLFSDFTISVNKGDASSMINQGICKPERIASLRGGVGRNLEVYSPQRFSADFKENKKKALGIPTDVLIIGIVARMVKEKGFLDMFKAFELVKKEFDNSILLVIGNTDNEKIDRLTAATAAQYGNTESIYFLGQRTDMPELYSIMDIFVLPSHREGFPATLMEAAAMGKAIITSDIIGCREVIEDGETGLLVPPQNIQLLANALITLIRSPELRKQLGENARKKAIRDFNESDFYNKQKEIYQKLITEKLGNVSLSES